MCYQVFVCLNVMLLTDKLIYPLIGSTTMALGLMRSWSKRTFLLVPSNEATSIVSEPESVQNMFRPIQSMATPSGESRSDKEKRPTTMLCAYQHLQIGPYNGSRPTFMWIENRQALQYSVYVTLVNCDQ